MASGINTSAFQIGDAVAVVSSVAVSYTSGADRIAALTEGYRAAFVVCVLLAAAGAAAALLLLGRSRPATGHGRGRPPGTATTPATAPRPARS